MEKLKIAIPGTRGIPNHYGGFEKLAEYLSAGLAGKGHDITVYNSNAHPFKGNKWKNVNIIHCYEPAWMGSSGQFFYDLNCIRHAARQGYDVIFFPGYTSSSIWGRFYPKKPLIISHMDGWEWKRAKYSPPVRRFLKYAEKLAVKYSRFFVADSLTIQSYLQEKYNIQSRYIAYGAEIYNSEDISVLSEYKISPGNYYLLMARMEPENNIEMILDGFHGTESGKKFIVIGNTGNWFGKKIIKKFFPDQRIVFAGAIYDNAKTHSLKFYSSLYFHGHSAGGTNPSLLEAMASRALIAAHDNPFNREVLNENGLYFSSADDVKRIISSTPRNREIMINNNLEAIKKYFNWEKVIDQYNKFIQSCYNSGKS